MHLTIRHNSHKQTVRLLLVNDADGISSAAGLTDQVGDLRVATIRDNESQPTVLPLTVWEGTDHTPGGLREIDATTMPGLYELGLPDALFADGAQRATVMVQGRGIRAQVIHIDLIAYDPYDSYRLGLDCLSREARHGVISRAFREVVPEIVEEFRRQDSWKQS